MHPAMQGLIKQLQPIKKEWEANPRLRFGVWIVLIVLSLEVINQAADWRASQQDSYQQTAQRLSRMQALQGQTVWQKRVISSQASLEKMQERLWRTTSASLARADVQAWLKQRIADSGISKFTMSVLPLTSSELPGVLELHASVSGTYTPASIAKLLYELESSSSMVVVSYLDLVNRRHQLFRLELLVYFKAPDDWVVEKGL